jgi:two-component system NarL family response regulator
LGRVRVLLAENRPLTCFGVRRALEEQGFVVCAEARDMESAVAATLRERPDVCVLDLHLPGGAVAATERIVAGAPETAVLVLADGDEGQLFEAICAGASGYVPTDADPDRLTDILTATLSGDVALPRTVVARFIDERRARSQRLTLENSGGARRLTGRESDVLDLVREGLATAEIAARLFVSEVTVRSHVCSIRKKLGLRDLTAAIASPER